MVYEDRDDKDKDVQFDKYGRTALTSDSGHIPPGYQLEESVDVSSDDGDKEDD